MRQITIRLPEEEIESLDEEAEEADVSRSEYVRDVIRSRKEHEELRNEVDELREEVERQKRERRQLLEQRDEHQELVAVVQEEKSIEERWRQADLMTRARWKIFGMPSEE
jgi:metal-responsive CopG/Arc/MetJ family transcriptional regulator